MGMAVMFVEFEGRVLALSLALSPGHRISYPSLHSGAEMKTMKTSYFLAWVTERHTTSLSVHLSYLQRRLHELTIPSICSIVTRCKFPELTG